MGWVEMRTGRAVLDAVGVAELGFAARGWCGADGVRVCWAGPGLAAWGRGAGADAGWGVGGRVPDFQAVNISSSAASAITTCAT